MGIVELIDDLRSHRRSLSSSQIMTSLVVCIATGWSGFTLANVPLVSPFALIGFPRDFLFWDGWWLVGNLIALCCMFLMGGLIRYMSERKQRSQKKFAGDSRLHRRIVKKSTTASPKPSKKSSEGENTKYTRQQFITELPRPHVSSPSTQRNDFSASRYGDFGTPMKSRVTPLGSGYQSQRASPHFSSPLSALQSDVTSKVLAAEDYVDEQVNKAQTPLREYRSLMGERGRYPLLIWVGRNAVESSGARIFTGIGGGNALLETRSSFAELYGSRGSLTVIGY